MRRRALIAGATLPLLACSGEPPATGGFAGASPERGHLLRSVRPPSAAAEVRRTGVVVAGAGVAGLAAARALRQRGIDDFVVLELEDQAGGNSRAGRLGGIACPLGAHYLPLPGDEAHEVQDLLEELGLRRRVAGRWQYDERHLCHSPQERLFFQGHWQEGLLPLQGVGPATLAQYRRFGARVRQLGRQARFAIPVTRQPLQALQRALGGQTFHDWLGREGLDDAQLRWYLDYCCRDDYGAGLDTVSAWAGIHYFASRHGFHVPGDGEADGREAVLTWPQGNGWLTQRLALPLGDRLRTGRVVLRIAEQRHGVEVDAVDAASGRAERWQAAHCVVALPAFVAARVLDPPPAFVRAAAAGLRYAPWVVANLHLDAPLRDQPGAAAAWDNVVYGGRGLGYVDASHQSLNPAPGPTVLSWYQAPGEAARGDLLQRPWQAWRDEVLAELEAPHPDLARRLRHVEVARYGHAMAIPVPGSLAHVVTGAPRTARLGFAHADWAGYSVFEEAFCLGHAAGLRAAGRGVS
ncbi:MAG TPA: FAD-dependent oxidoreductase [Ramlibacter sp.]|nr:FAD-dependent oxidoreductase [Ramlibacter sp.]